MVTPNLFLSVCIDHIYKYGREAGIKIADLPPGAFPDNLVMADGYDLSAADDITKIYDDLKDELLEPEEKKDQDESDSPLIAQLRARQRLSFLKVPLAEDLARDAYENGNYLPYCLSISVRPWRHY